MRLYCSTCEKFPLRLVDVTELFFQELRSRGVEQVWYCRPGPVPGGLRTEYVGGIPVVVPPTFGAGGPLGEIATRLCYWFLEAVFLLRLLGSPPDVIMIRDKYWGAAVGFLVARLTRRKFVIWLSYPYPEHDAVESIAAAGVSRWLRKARSWLGVRLLYRFAMPRADHNFVQSERMKADLVAWGVPPERMTAVPMGIKKGFHGQIDPAILPVGPPLILHLGSLSAVRRLEVLVDAFALVASRRPDVRFRFVGDGDLPAERRALEERVRKAGLQEVVQFTGMLPMAEAWKYVSEATVCVSPIPDTPLLRVASPTKFIEYLAFAKPTVGNSHPEQSMIAGLCDGARIVDWSPQAFADGILWCLDHPVEAREMARRGRSWVQQNRTYDRIADLVHQELKRIVSGPSSAAATVRQ